MNEILDLISGTNNVSIDRQAFFDMKSQYYLDHAKEVRRSRRSMEVISVL